MCKGTGSPTTSTAPFSGKNKGNFQVTSKRSEESIFPTSLSIDFGREDRQENMWVAVDGRV